MIQWEYLKTMKQFVDLFFYNKTFRTVYNLNTIIKSCKMSTTLAISRDVVTHKAVSILNVHCLPISLILE